MKPYTFCYFIFLIFYISFVSAEPLVHVTGPLGREKQIRFCERESQKISQELLQKWSLSSPGNIQIILTKDEKEFNSLLRSYANSQVPSWALAVAVSHRNLILIKAFKLDLLENSLISTLRHELVHLYLGKISEKSGMPRYFNEGLAMWFSGSLFSLSSQKKLEVAIHNKSLVPFENISTYFPPHSLEASLSYIQSQSLIQYLLRNYGEKKLFSTLKKMKEGEGFLMAIQEIYGKKMEVLIQEWKQSFTSGWNFSLYFLVLFLSDGNVFFGVLSLIVIGGVIRIRFKNKKLLKKWEEQDEFLL